MLATLQAAAAYCRACLGNKLVFIQLHKHTEPVSIKSRNDVGKSHVQNMVVHNDVAVVFVMQIHIVRAVHRKKNWECGSKEVEEIWD